MEAERNEDEKSSTNSDESERMYQFKEDSVEIVNGKWCEKKGGDLEDSMKQKGDSEEVFVSTLKAANDVSVTMKGVVSLETCDSQQVSIHRRWKRRARERANLGGLVNTVSGKKVGEDEELIRREEGKYSKQRKGFFSDSELCGDREAEVSEQPCLE